MTENTAPEYDGNTAEAPEPEPSPGELTEDDVADDANLWAKAELDDDAAVDEHGNDPDEA